MNIKLSQLITDIDIADFRIIDEDNYALKIYHLIEFQSKKNQKLIYEIISNILKLKN